jgi:hypothetical protein
MFKKWWNKLLSKNKKYNNKKNLSYEKEKATKNHEPWVGIVSINVDPEDMGSGSFELDWNEIFVARLVRLGWSGKNDVDIVNAWFSDLCGGVYYNMFEDEMADPDNRKPKE